MAEVTGSLPFLVDADSGKNDVCCWDESSFFLLNYSLMLPKRGSVLMRAKTIAAGRIS